MEYKEIKQLMEDMQNSKLASIDIELPDGTKISMKKEENGMANMPLQTILKEEEKIEEEKNLKIETMEEEGNIVKSPMVGTFYIKPSPTENPYVEIGKSVKKGDILCIVEAMKLMNTIESEFDGKIKEIFVKDGETVEYGKPLFRIV